MCAPTILCASLLSFRGADAGSTLSDIGRPFVLLGGNGVVALFATHPEALAGESGEARSKAVTPKGFLQGNHPACGERPER